MRIGFAQLRRVLSPRSVKGRSARIDILFHSFQVEQVMPAMRSRWPGSELMKIIKVQTEKKKEIKDISDIVQKSLESFADDGLCHLFLTHTTAALTTADLDPGTDLDMLEAFGALVPRLKYRHPHDPAHFPDHLVSSLIGTSLLVPVKNRKLVLGTWQRIVLVELDGPRHREILLSFLAER